MKYLGNIRERAIYYLSTKYTPKWAILLPKAHWVAFTIADNTNKEELWKATAQILEKGAGYTCSAGEQGDLMHSYFDDHIVLHALQQEEKTGKAFDYEYAPMTTGHQNFSEGFWFAITLAYDDWISMNKVICLDFTTRKVEQHLTTLIQKIKEGWLPSDQKIEKPLYDY